MQNSNSVPKKKKKTKVRQLKIKKDQDPAEKEENKYGNMDAAKRERVKEVFQMFDKEQQGFIDTESLGTLLRWLNFNPTETEMLEYVDTYDQ